MTIIYLKKGEDRRIRAGHPWVFSNEIDTTKSPLKNYSKGDEVTVLTHQGEALGMAYINPHSLITARLFSRDLQDHLTIDFFIRRLEAAYTFRKRLFKKPYYRLVFSEGDELPGLVIDRFGDDFVMQTNTAGMEQKIELITAALCTLFPDLHSILLRNDSPIRQHEGLASYSKPVFGKVPDYVQLEENGIVFKAPLQEGQKTGWFYDHRVNRARLQAYVANAAVLDVFSYLGGFGIHAAHFGAKSVDCIEASAYACEWIKQNAKLNQVEDRIHIICDDAFDSMKNLQAAGKQYDVIILDPPAFVKKRKDQKEGRLAYQRLNELALKLLAPGGILISCSCSMQVSMDDLLQLLGRAAHRTHTTIHLIERGHQGPDHPIHLAIPETDYLKAIIVAKTS